LCYTPGASVFFSQQAANRSLEAEFVSLSAVAYLAAVEDIQQTA